MARSLALAVLALLAAGCESGDDNASGPTAPTDEICGGYPDWATSAYVLPYPVGRAHRVSQGNCTQHSHQGTLRYAYDLEMPFGSIVTSARDGVVVGLRIDQPAGSRGLTGSNWIQIQHADGVVSEYVHLEQFGNLVEVGDAVQAGDPIARTGDTGDVGTFPHVHFDLVPCGSNLACTTLPVTFSNTTPHPGGLVENVVYEALPY